MSSSGERQKKGKWGEIWQRLTKNKTAMLGLVILALLIAMALCANMIGDYGEVAIRMNVKERLQAPSTHHLFGTDAYGRDILTRIAHGARVSLVIGFVAVGLAVLVGGAIGACSGFYGGRFDTYVMRFMDIIMAIPSTIFALAVVAALGPGLVNLMLAISIADIPNFARVVRSAVLTIRNADFIEAAQAVGASPGRIMGRHIIPNVMGPIIVQSTLGIGSAILNAAGLSFIGLGLQPPRPEWGSMLSEAKQYIQVAPHMIIIPGIFIALAVLSLNLLGDGFRDAMDPRLRD